MAYQVKQIAKLVGISARTLHYYDQIGLLKPAQVTESGYRLYDVEDLEKLQQIMFFKELDFPLKAIKDLLENPDFDKREALMAHRELLMIKRNRMDQMIDTIDGSINAMNGGKEMSKKDMFKAFDKTEIEAYKEKYADEVRSKYPKETVNECSEKTKNYTSDDWSNIQEEGDKLFHRLAQLMEASPDDAEVQKLIEAYRTYISENFYDCTLEIFSGLADLYVQDERFTKNIDQHGEGLSEFLRDAIQYYCRHAKA